MHTEAQLVNEFINLLTPGKAVDIELGGPLKTRIKPLVVGFDLGKYIVLKFPQRLNISDYKDVVVSGNSSIVRYIVEGDRGECVAFSTTIEHVSTIPDSYIYINYPKKIEKRQLRSTQREKTHLPTKITQSTNDEISIDGYVIDISERGCQFSFKANNSNSKGSVKKCPINIFITLTGKYEPLELQAHVKNSRIENGYVLVGIMFDNASLEKVALLLEDMA